jgi:hypothetical protein
VGLTEIGVRALRWAPSQSALVDWIFFSFVDIVRCETCGDVRGIHESVQGVKQHLAAGLRVRRAAADVPQPSPTPRLGQICRKVSFWRTNVLRHLAALRPSTASDVKAAVARYNTIETASAGSKAPQNGRYGLWFAAGFRVHPS